METTKSKDGTAIAYERTGKGPSLVLVHGTSADHTRWAPILPGLNEHFTVYAIDRRGRGGSSDTADYAIEREFEDVAAVVNAVPEPVNLLGHSYGAVCSLFASLLTPRLRRLVLYEPPLPTGDASAGMYPPGVFDRVSALMAKGDRDGVVSTFLTDVPRLPAHELAMLKTSPSWQGRLAAAHTIPREMQDTSGQHVFDVEALRNMKTPTLLLLGGDSPAFFGAAIDLLHRTLPNNRVVVLPGQQHVAINTAPDLFLREVLQFLTEL